MSDIPENHRQLTTPGALTKAPRAITPPIRGEKALVLFSGGQDSTTCLVWALRSFAHVETIGFHYGQRHAVELDQRRVIRARLESEARDWTGRYGPGKLGPDHLIALNAFGAIGETAMTGDIAIALDDKGLPNTFVPGRNLAFLTFAAALAYRRGIKHLVGGMCETDFSGYPDCRDDAVKAMQVALKVGMDSRFVIETPLMWLDKAAVWALAEYLGGNDFIETIIADTHTCYLGERGLRHDWGYGCGQCPACRLRADGFYKWRQTSQKDG